MDGNIIKVGIAGQGRSGFEIHARWLRTVPHQYQIVAVADLLPERRKQAQQEFGCRVYKTHLDMIRAGGFDLFINALPSNLHPLGSIQALTAGYHTVSEKPCAVKVADFDKIVAASRKSGKSLMPFQNSRFQPAFIKIRELLDSGLLGDLIHARLSYSGFGRRWDWQTRQDLWGGNLNNTGPHPMDMAIMLFGERSPQIYAKLVSGPGSFGDADDFALVVLHGPKAPTIEVLVSSYLAFPQGDTFSINGTRGGMAGNFTALKWRYYDPAQAPKQKLMKGWSHNRTFCNETLSWTEDSWKCEIPDLFQTLSGAFYNNVHEVILKKAQPVVTLAQVRRQVAALEACHRQNPLPKLAAKKGR
jgi:scyllo-inositol 2-dehydrogenase (NADP+)